MTFGVPSFPGVGWEGFGAQGDALVEFDVPAYYGGFADDDAGGVVDEEAFAYFGAGVDVDAGPSVAVLRHDPGDKGNAEGVELVGQALDGDGLKARIAEDHFLLGEAGGVAVVGGLDVGLDEGSDFGESQEEDFRKGSGFGFAAGLVAVGAFVSPADIVDASQDLLGKLRLDFLKTVDRDRREVRFSQTLGTEKAGKDES